MLMDNFLESRPNALIKLLSHLNSETQVLTLRTSIIGLRSSLRGRWSFVYFEEPIV